MEFRQPFQTKPFVTCACGCGRATPTAKANNKRYGHRKGHPTRFCQGHRPRKPDYNVGGECWIWAKSFVSGYGQLGSDGKICRAHRVYFERKYGPIPEGMHLHHICGDPRCVRPEHLKPMTPKEHRRLSAKLSIDKAREIRERAAAGETQASLAHEFGVSKTTVSRVVQRRTWADV